MIEAVFEDTSLKHKVFQEVQNVVAPDALLCSNTSTLPITALAEGVERQEGLHRAAFLLARRQDAAGRDHQGRAHRRGGPGPRLRPGPPDQQDPDRGQRLPRLLHLPGHRPLHQRGRGDGRRGHRARVGRAGGGPGRLPGQGALPDGRAHPHPAAEDPPRDAAGRRGGGRHLDPAPGRGGRGPDGRRVRPRGPRRRGRRLLRLRRERQARPAVAGAARALHQRAHHSVPRHAGADAVLRGAGHRPAARGGRAHLRRGRQHRLHPRHRLPRLDRRRPAVHQRLRGGPRGFVARARELAERYGERFTPPALLVEKAEKGEVFTDAR